MLKTLKGLCVFQCLSTVWQNDARPLKEFTDDSYQIVRKGEDGLEGRGLLLVSDVYRACTGSGVIRIYHMYSVFMCLYPYAAANL